jgi:hypothetical protein
MPKNKTYVLESGRVRRRVHAGSLRSAVTRALARTPLASLGPLMRCRELPDGVWRYLDPRAFLQRTDREAR